jgi:hypothetical protein
LPQAAVNRPSAVRTDKGAQIVRDMASLLASLLLHSSCSRNSSCSRKGPELTPKTRQGSS